MSRAKVEQRNRCAEFMIVNQEMCASAQAKRHLNIFINKHLLFSTIHTIASHISEEMFRSKMCLAKVIGVAHKMGQGKRTQSTQNR